MNNDFPMSAAESLQAFVAAPNQRFVCSMAGANETNQLRTFRVEHCLREPPTTELLKELRNCSAAAQLVDFYDQHDGALLFRDLESDAAGVELLKSANWPLLTEAIRDVLSKQSVDDGRGWLEHFVAFGEASHSGNYFVLPTAGSDAGKVLYCDHEGPITVWAPDFLTFIADLIDDPAEQLDRMGCFLRFERDGKQWIPERFLSGDDLPGRLDS